MSLKSENRRTVLACMRNGENRTIAEITEETGISKTTLKKILEYFIIKDLVSCIGKGESTDEGGKKPDLFVLNRDFGYVISICITMHDIFSAINNMSNRIIISDSHPIKRDEPLENIIKYIGEISGRYMALATGGKERLLGVALGFPGIMDAERGIGLLAPNYPSWGINVPIKEKLLDILKIDCPVYVENVNRFQAIAEKEWGIAQGHDSFMIIEGGYGFGGAVFDSENPRRGNNFMAGEVGHMVVDPNSQKKCTCGAYGCLNALVRVEDIIEKAVKGYKTHPDSILFVKNDPENIVIEDVFTASNKGDELAETLMDEVINWFAVGISNIYTVYDPGLVVIQGIFTKAGEYFLTHLQDRAENMVLKNMRKKFMIKYSVLGVEREVVGGATLVLRDFFGRNELFGDR
jgi:predicted NBD/HSP70 family sugar kinase